MSVARIWKRVHTTFLFPGWLPLVIGGTIALLVIFFVTAVPWSDDAPVPASKLPENRGETLPAPGRGYRVDLLANGTTLERGGYDRGPYVIHIHRDATWLAIRDLFEGLRDEAVEDVRIAVVNRDGSVGAIPFKLLGPWPTLDTGASAQAFVDAIR